MIRRKWFVWHSWTGLTAGLMLFVICWSGTVAVFSYEIDWLLNPTLRTGSTVAEPSWDQVKHGAEATFPESRVLQIAAPFGNGFATEVLLLRPDGRMWRAYADPANGRILGDTSYFNVQRFFRSFHMNLFFISEDFDLGYWGFRLVEFFALVLLGSLVTSLVFYRRWWRGFFRLETGRGARIFWSDLHKLAGVWNLWFVAAIALTGLWYFVEEFVPGSPSAPSLPEESRSTAVPPPDLDALIDRAESAMRGFEVSRVWLGEEAAAPVEVYGFDGALLVRDRASKVWLDPSNGELLGIQRTSDLNPLERWIDTADPVHFGSFAGLVSKTLWFVCGLALSALTLTGAYLQVKRQRRRRHPVTARGPVVLAYLTTVAILTTAAVGGWYEIRSYGPLPDGGPVFPEVTWPVFSFIAAWIVSTVGILTVWMWKLR
jgi:uncharacterized iron-regulated membrane protein